MTSPAGAIRFRRQTAAVWASTNPVLALGEPGVTSDAPYVMAVGDGTTAWADLEKFQISGDQVAPATTRPTGMRWWDTRVYANEQDALNVLVVGDSISEGFSATLPEKMYTRRLARTIADNLSRGRGIYYPGAPGGAGYPDPSHNPWTKVGGLDDTTSKLGLAQRVWHNNAQNTATISGTFRCSQFKVYFTASFVTANARIFIDGVLADTVDTSSVTSGETIEWTSSTLDLGDHTVLVRNDNAGSFIIVDGVLAIEDPTNTVNMWSASFAGYGATHWASTTEVGPAWDTALAHTDADVAVLALGVNDETFGQTPAQLVTNLEAIATRVQNALTVDPSIVILVEWANGNDAVGTWDPYAAALRAMAKTNNWGLVDIDAFVGHTVGDPYALDADNLHPNDSGMGVWANEAAKVLLGESASVLETAVRSADVNRVVQITQAAYDALDPPDDQTLYIVVG